MDMQNKDRIRNQREIHASLPVSRGVCWTVSGDFCLAFAPNYGEFDAIVVSPGAAYLIESKWDKSNMPNEVLELKRAQMLRHEILAWYIENWAEGDWDEFRRSHNQVFEQKFGKAIPPSQSLLGQNLRTILTAIRGRKLRNVLLYFYTHQLPKMVTDFEIVTIQYEPKLGNFVEIVV